MNHVTKSKTMSFLAAAVLSAAPVLAQSTTRPAFPGERGGMGERRGGFGGERGGFGGERGGMGETGASGGESGENRWRMRGPGRTATEEQWDDILKFMREVSPRRTAAYDEMTAQANKDLIKKLVTARYDNLMNVKREDPALYEVQIEKTKAEDTIFGVLTDHRTSNKPVNEDDKKALREQVTKVVDANLKEREMRIEKARKSLTEASARLDEDRKQRDSLVDEKLSQYLRDGARPLKMDGRDRLERGERRDGERKEPERVKAD